MRLALITLAAASLTFGTARAADPHAALARAMEGKAVPAMGVLIIKDGEVAQEAARGVRRNDRLDAARPGDPWHLGSDTKPMTATLIARLVDEGRLSWTARLDQMLPDLAARMRSEYRDVTLVDLLSHRSGLPENVSDEGFFLSFYDDRRALPAQRFDYVARALTEEPVGPKRQERRYSNTGYVLAAVIAERATGETYEKLVAGKVFGPLGMTSATFAPAGDGEPVGHVNGRPAQPRDANPAMFNPAGQARMTLVDWAKFCIDQMKGDDGQGRVLKTATYRFIHTPQGGAAASLGWGVAAKALGRQGPAYTHAGSDGNWNAIAILFPAGDNGVLVTANAAESMEGDKATVQVARELVVDLAPPAP